MIFIDGTFKDTILKKYKSLSCTTKKCSACKKEPWENGKFEFWISKDNVGYLRTCLKCGESQTLATPKKIKDQIQLNKVIFNLTSKLK